jgi:hypothetical protein
MYVTACFLAQKPVFFARLLQVVAIPRLAIARKPYSRKA